MPNDVPSGTAAQGTAARLAALQGNPTVPVGAVEAPQGSRLAELARRLESGRRKNAASKPKRDNTLRTLLGKTLVGAGQPGEGVIPFAVLPKSIRDNVRSDQPPIGWDPAQLSKRELALLGRFQSMAEGFER